MSPPKKSDQDGEDGEVVISVRASVIRWLLTAALGAGGGVGGSMGEHLLHPAEAAVPAPPVTEQLEGKLRLQRLEDDVHVVKERAAEDRARIGKLEERLVPASYRAPGR